MKRLNFIDIAKGIGIIAVVVGHSTQIDTLKIILFWFHMPLFFFISGFLFKQRQGIIKRKAKQLLIPYLSYFIIISFIQDLFNPIGDVKAHIFNFLSGGENLTYYFGVFWFITCLYFTTVTFNFIIKVRFKVIIILIMYLLSYINSVFFRNVNFIENINVVFFSIVFFYLGWLYQKDKNNNYLNNSTVILSSVGIIFLIIVFMQTNQIEFIIDMKSQQYNHLFLDIIVPICFIFIVFKLSKIIGTIPNLSTILISIGRSSLTIMYLHVPLIIVINNFYNPNLIEITLICILLPLFLDYLLNQLKFTRKFLLGK